ncbi:kinesin-associated protein-domain-containing protein [Haematococcus lacustris]
MGDVKKKIKPGQMELHPEELAIVVNYEVQEIQTQPDGTQQLLNREQTNKKITVKSLNESSNVAQLAQEIVDKCKLIHPSKVGQVEELLQKLLKRSNKGNGKSPSAATATPPSDGSPPAPSRKAVKTTPPAARRNEPGPEEVAEMRARQQAQASQIFKAQQKQYEPAYVKQLDTYIEELYEEDMSHKVHATGMIAQLFRQTENFESLLSHETLLQTLARLMREEMKKSIDLCVNIVSVFFSISNFSQFHQIIMDNQVGALTMDLIDLEIKRTEHRAAEEGISPSMVAQKALDAAQGTVQLNDRERKLLTLIQKQDRLLYLCLYMLLNLSEDVGVEKKMKKKNVVVYLVKMLDRSNVELLILATTFLKKLSIYKENKEKMVECRIIDKLAKFVPVRNDVLLMSVLRLLHNLSFDGILRDAMVKNGLIPKCVELMVVPRFQPVVLGLLYHISMEDKYKSLFTYSECIPRIYEMLTRVQDLRNTPELIALAVNLTQNGRNAEALCEGDRFDRLIRRAFQTRDELAFKVMRNLAQQEAMSVKRRFGPYIEQMVQLLKLPEITAELFVEVLGCLANLYLPEFDFFNLVRKHDLLRFLATYAQPGAVDDDILLEVVMFVGVLCNEGTAHMLCDSGLVNTLFQLMGEKKEDDEFVLQIAFAFNKFMMYEETRSALLGQTQVVFYLVDLLQDKNKEVRRVADQCLDVIMDTDEEWAVRIRSLKFESFNAEWLDVVAAPPEQNITTHGLGGHVPGYGGHYDSAELDYADGEVGNYNIGGQRVVANFDDDLGQDIPEEYQ